jgi:hypothetical protein
MMRRCGVRRGGKGVRDSGSRKHTCPRFTSRVLINVYILSYPSDLCDRLHNANTSGQATRFKPCGEETLPRPPPIESLRVCATLSSIERSYEAPLV